MTMILITGTVAADKVPEHPLTEIRPPRAFSIKCSDGKKAHRPIERLPGGKVADEVCCSSNEIAFVMNDANLNPVSKCCDVVNGMWVSDSVVDGKKVEQKCIKANFDVVPIHGSGSLLRLPILVLTLSLTFIVLWI